MSLWGLEEGEGLLLHSLLCVLRVPGLALLDLWWTERAADSVPKSLELEPIADSGLSLLLLLLALALLLLPLQDLLSVYLHSLSAGALAVAALIATQYVEDEAKREEHALLPSPSWAWPHLLAFLTDSARRHLCPIASYVTLTSLVSWCLGLTNPVLSRVLPSAYILPIAARLLGCSLPLLTWLTRVSSGFLVLASLIYVGLAAGTVFLYLADTWAMYSLVRRLEGSLTLLLLTARRLLETHVLLLYWLVLLSSQIWTNYFELMDKKYIIQDSDWLVQGLVAVSEICESPLVLIATCIVLMVLSCGALALTSRLLSLCGGAVGPGAPALQAGLTEGVVAFVLALQTGLIEIEMPARIGALSIILFVVLASLLQSCLDLTTPVLLSLPATNRRLLRHLPALLLLAALLLSPLLMVHALLTRVSSDLWTLVIISSCLVTALQATASLATYLLFVWDSSLETPSPHIDDYVYYVKATSRSGELLLAVAVVCCGFWESLGDTREWSLVNSLVLVVHCYFNIYSRISQGWASYLQRRQTSMRLSELCPAPAVELAEHGDVCSICYQDMVAGAVRTECRHYFHTHCLRRWLVVQDNCPMCTQSIVAKREESDAIGVEEEVVEEEERLEVEEAVAEEAGDEDASEKEDGGEVFEEEGLRHRAGASTGGVSPLFDGD